MADVPFFLRTAILKHFGSSLGINWLFDSNKRYNSYTISETNKQTPCKTADIDAPLSLELLKLNYKLIVQWGKKKKINNCAIL